MTTLRKIFTILTIIWMVVIFAHSAQSDNDSKENSIRVCMLFGRIFVPDFEDWPEERQLEFVERIDHPVRKAAHFTEYAILSFFVAGAYLSAEKKGRKRFLIPWAFGSIYAATDEFHQLFVSGRNGAILDVLLDGSGAAFGTLAFLFIVYLISKKKKETVVNS